MLGLGPCLCLAIVIQGLCTNPDVLWFGVTSRQLPCWPRVKALLGSWATVASMMPCASFTLLEVGPMVCGCLCCWLALWLGWCSLLAASSSSSDSLFRVPLIFFCWGCPCLFALPPLWLHPHKGCWMVVHGDHMCCEKVSSSTTREVDGFQRKSCMICSTLS